MSWTKIDANGGMGIEAQHLLRWNNVPACSLKKQGDGWRASLLCLSGISTRSLSLQAVPLEQAKAHCEEALIAMGYQRPGANNG